MLRFLKRLLQPQPQQLPETVFVMQFRRNDERFVVAVATQEDEAMDLCRRYAQSQAPGKEILKHNNKYYAETYQTMALALYTEVAIDYFPVAYDFIRDQEYTGNS